VKWNLLSGSEAARKGPPRKREVLTEIPAAAVKRDSLQSLPEATKGVETMKLKRYAYVLFFLFFSSLSLSFFFK